MAEKIIKRPFRVVSDDTQGLNAPANAPLRISGVNGRNSRPTAIAHECANSPFSGERSIGQQEKRDGRRYSIRVWGIHQH
jgi:hypothetical protein